MILKKNIDCLFSIVVLVGRLKITEFPIGDYSLSDPFSNSIMETCQNKERNNTSLSYSCTIIIICSTVFTITETNKV